MRLVKKHGNIESYLSTKQEEWEALCRRCGGCCGSFDDPCIHLRQDGERSFSCAIYDQRFGVHHALSGEEFTCVPIQEVIDTYWKKDYLCIYKRKLGKR